MVKTKKPLNMSYKRFNRHEIFDDFLMDWHSTTIKLVRDYIWETKGEVMSNLENMLCGIWDGYLYDNLVSEAKSVGLPYEDVERISDTARLINEYINEKGESITNVW